MVDKIQTEKELTNQNKRSRRNKLQIYFDILSSIKEESVYEEIKPTRIQYLSNLSYDNLISYLAELEKISLISTNPIKLTQKGNNFLNEYSEVQDLIKKLGLEYL